MTTTEQPPSSASPALAAGLGATVSSIYAEGEDAILAAITLHVRAALNATVPGDALRDRTAPVRAAAQRTMAGVERRAARTVPQALSAAYGRGRGIEQRATGEAVRVILERLTALRTAVLNWVGQLVGKLTAALRTPTPLPLAGGVLQQAAGRGITAFRDNRGRAVGLVPYVEQLVQHAAGGAVIDGFTDRLAADGDDLVIVTESPHPCPLCTPWEHKVLSVSGADLHHPSMATAREAGLFHPNCHHTIARWHPGFTWPPHSLHHRPGTYVAVQRQRDIERAIRSWKRREAAALDDATRAKAGAKVRAWQAELRRHVAAEGLTRSRQRERTDFGRTAPFRHAHGAPGPGRREPAKPKPASGLKSFAEAADGPGVKHERLYGGQTARTELVTLPDGRKAVHKTPRSAHEGPGDVRFWMDGEELAPLVARAVGAPVAEVYRDAPDSVWVEYLQGAEGAGKLVGSREGVRLGLLDALIGNRDRNLMTRDGKLVGFDHGGAWLGAELGDDRPVPSSQGDPLAHFTTTDGEWREQVPVTRAELDRIETQLQALRPDFRRAGRESWLDYSLRMLEQLRQHADR